LRTFTIIYSPKWTEFSSVFAIVAIIIFKHKDFVQIWKVPRSFWKKHCYTGILLSLLLYLSLYILCLISEKIGIEYSQAVKGKDLIDKPSANWAGIAIEPILYQTFFTGLILSKIKKHINLIVFIYLGGLLFALGSFQLNPAAFLTGMISALIYHRQETLIAPVIFNVNTFIAGQLSGTVFQSAAPIMVLFY